MTMPAEVRTSRLLLRPWRGADAPPLLPILEANRDHLASWIPAHVSTPVPIPALAQRLDGFGADFAADRTWRFAMLTRDALEILGGVDLLPRVEAERLPYAQADRVELGYWIRVDATGQGYVTEAARALLALAATLPRFMGAEIRCDTRNAPSAAVAARLGFTLSHSLTLAPRDPTDAAIQLDVWTSSLASFK